MTALDLIDGWGSLLEGEARDRLERDALPPFLLRQRWFAGKARTLEGARVVDASAPGGLGGSILLALVEARYRDGAADLYLVPLGIAVGSGAETLVEALPDRVLARVARPDGPGILFDALADPEACAALLESIARGRQVPTASGVIRAFPTTAFAEARGPVDAALPARLSRAEQSNSAVLFGDRLILKVFRRLEPGVNPDFEIGRFLTEATGFGRIPTTAGAIEYDRPGSGPITLAILQGLVPNEGTGWDHALAELARFYEAADRDGSPAPAEAPGQTLLESAAASPTAETKAAIGPYLEAAATLGRRTAEMHRALGSGPAGSAFAADPMTPGDLEALAAEVRAQVEAGLGALRTMLDRLPESVRGTARLVLDAAPGLLGRADSLAGSPPASAKIRCHGDYHLGQVLRTGDDFVLLDFEGEPAKPLAKRLEKQPPAKDVVGMLRSFDYAAYAGLFAFAAGGEEPDAADRLAPWARAWRSWTSAAFLGAYLEAIAGEGASIWPADPAGAERLLRAFLLDKALYELLYELNNRPAWVGIPLRGIADLVERGRPAGPGGPDGPAWEDPGTGP